MDFEAYLVNFLSNDDPTRRAAEAYFNELMVHRDDLPLQLVHVRGGAAARACVYALTARPPHC